MTASSKIDSAQVYVLMTGTLSKAALEELRKRVKAGEPEVQVKAELLLKEGKGIAG